MLGVPLPRALVCLEIERVSDSHADEASRAVVEGGGGEADNERSSEREDDLP
jgi:hypothetical protein